MLLAASVTILGGRPDSSAAVEAGFRKVGELAASQFSPVVVDPASRKLIAMEAATVDFYDADTLQRTASLPLAPYSAGVRELGNPTVFAWEPGQARLYLLVYNPIPASSTASTAKPPASNAITRSTATAPRI